MTLSRIGLISLSVLVVLGVIIYVVPYLLSDDSRQTVNDGTPVSEDPLVRLQQSNGPYAEAMRQIKSGDLNGALENLQTSKTLASSPDEHANIDFAIADVHLSLNRSEGIDAYSALALNPEYPERTRALALLRAYLMYKKFNQSQMLQQLAANHEIIWTTPEQVTYEIMRKISDLHTFPYAQVKMLDFELNAVTDSLVAEQLLRQQKPTILSGFDNQKKYIGETTELTSGMLAYANLLARIYVDFATLDSEEIASTYQELIDYDNARNLHVNKQYTLLAYANFLAGDNQIEKATSVINILLDEALTPALAEALPVTDAQVVYPYLYTTLSNETTDEGVRSFIATIGSKNR